MDIFSQMIFTTLAPRSIQSISCNVRVWMCGCVVPSVGDGNRDIWKLLVKGLIALTAKLRTPCTEKTLTADTGQLL